jgi:microsomal epoxide hydrolase
MSALGMMPLARERRKVITFRSLYEDHRMIGSTRFGIVFAGLICSLAPSGHAQAVPRPTMHGPRLPWVDRWLVTSDSVRLHYVSGGSGSGPTIVLVPGWTMPAEIWEPQLRHFARSTRVIALDPRSQGASQRTSEGNYTERRARDIHELIAQIKAPQVVLVGWSMGVPEVLSLIEQFGTSGIAGVVLVDNVVFIPPNSPFSAFMDTLQYHLLRDRPVLNPAFVRGMYRTPQDSAYLARITRASLSTPTTTAYTLLVGTFGTGRRDWRPALDKVDRPLLFVGEAMMRETADTVRNHVHDAEVEIFENAGHALFVDEADHFNQVLENFLKRLK